MRIAVGSDEVCALSEAIVEALSEMGHQAVVVARGAEWPEVGHGVATLVAGGEADAGVVMCFTGTGVSMAANKVPGARAALCGDVETARGARRWNDANVLALSIRATGVPLAREILDCFLDTKPEPDELPAIERLEEGSEVEQQ